ncbi:jg880 [Pararge aegeria aegeria]|uniref:Jg880 protein n=1 Tax=Pararge aegeria aegeria TaxID=348720 RepID=A0A8S4QX73_9NEOP|nr:jg880 [Pararge aegeria aegeria]
MTGYTILKTENLPDSLNGKPRWMICMVFTAGLLIMTLSATAAGVFIGYTYCYVEHRTGFRSAGNISQAQDIRTFNVPLGDAAEDNSINRAIVSSRLVQTIMRIGHQILSDNHSCSPGLKSNISIKESIENKFQKLLTVQ